MSKNIVICSDGTGNSGGKSRGTNVWRLYNAVDRQSDGTAAEQITHYDDGVGTDNLRWLRALGGAFGLGLSRNILRAYEFLVLTYEPGDRMFFFGFSRGAFTVRSLVGLIVRCGLLDRRAYLELTRGERSGLLRRLLKAYRSAQTVPDIEGEPPEEKAVRVRAALELGDLELATVPIHFIGVWDTVDAVGLPFDDLKVLDHVWRRLFKRRLWGFHDRRLGRAVHHAYQALALDDERRTFHPNIWEQPNRPRPAIPTRGDAAGEGAPERAPGDEPAGPFIEQVWFAGAHSNVGGGYPKDALSLVSLDWLMGKAVACGLRFIDGERERYRAEADAFGRLYDSRTGTGAFYRYAPRELYHRRPDPPRDDAGLGAAIDYTVRRVFNRLRPVSLPPPFVHQSVFDRIARGADDYAPKVIGEDPDIAYTDAGPYAAEPTDASHTQS